MASLHHCHHHPPTTTTIATCYCCCTTYCTPLPHPPPPDPLLHSIASQSHHLHHHSPPQPHHYSPYPNQSLNPHNHHCTQSQYHRPQTHQQEQQTQQPPIVSSLLRRIAALESSLRRQYSANYSTSYSLRDAAARTIQTHFRAFLVRRSRTLRQLKELTFVKSALNALKTTLSENTHLDSQALSRKAMGLLLKLDSIQGGDPMIKDGKRSISRELIRFLELIDGVSVKRSDLSSRAVKNVRFGGNGSKTRVLHNVRRIGTDEYGDLGGDERKLIEELRGQIEKIQGFSRVSEDCEDDMGKLNPSISINGNSGRHRGLLKKHGGVQSKVKKSVSFAENGNVSRVFRNTHEPVSDGEINSSDGSGSIDDERELMDNLCREVEEIGVFTKDAQDEEGHTEDGDSPQISDGERDARRNLSADGNYEISGRFEGQNGKFVFSAPLPVKMESKADMMKKRKAVKIVN